VGDLFVLGYPLLAKITAYKTGHALNASLVKRIYAEKLYQLVELSEPAEERAPEPLLDEGLCQTD
jgi:UDP-3-O-[3-hydroxymyristoyl] N-acetylglucosamine deacetylase